MTYYPYAQHLSDVYTLTRGALRAVLNDPDDPDYIGMTSEVTGLDSAGVIESADSLPMEDGGVHGDFFYDRRPITMNVEVFNTPDDATRTARMDKLRRVVNAMRDDAVLSWKPAGRYENWVPQPNFNAITLWSANPGQHVTAGASVTTQTGTVYEGANAGQVTTTSAAVNEGAGITVTGPFNVGVPYTATIYVRAQTGTLSNLQIALGSGSSDRGIVTVASVPSTSWTPMTVTWTPTITHATAVLAVRNSTATAMTWFMDAASVAPAAHAAPTYSDGNTAGWYWQGTTDNSAAGTYIEMMTNVRRQQPYRETGQGWAKQLQIALVSADSRLYSVAPRTVSATATSATAGGSVTFEQRGSDERGTGVFAITGPVTGATITQTGGGQIKLLGNVASGATWEIDLRTHRARLAGGRWGSLDAYIDWLNTMWPLLTPGNNVFTMTATGMTTGVSGFSFTANDTWV